MKCMTKPYYKPWNAWLLQNTKTIQALSIQYNPFYGGRVSKHDYQALISQQNHLVQTHQAWLCQAAQFHLRQVCVSLGMWVSKNVLVLCGMRTYIVRLPKWDRLKYVHKDIQRKRRGDYPSQFRDVSCTAPRLIDIHLHLFALDKHVYILIHQIPANREQQTPVPPRELGVHHLPKCPETFLCWGHHTWRSCWWLPVEMWVDHHPGELLSKWITGHWLNHHDNLLASLVSRLIPVDLFVAGSCERSVFFMNKKPSWLTST